MAEEQSHRQPAKAAWVFALALFPLGLGGFLLGLRDIHRGRESLHWPVVDGRVLSAQLAHSPLGADQPEVRYLYSVNRQPFVSSRLWPDEDIGNMPLLRRTSSEKIIQMFPVGATVAVHVSPADPGRSALIAGPRRAIQWTIGFAAFLVLGLWSPLALGRFLNFSVEKNKGRGRP